MENTQNFQKKMTMTFKRGDFVRIAETTHDDRMPKSRLGHLIEEVRATIHYTDKAPKRTQVWKVYMVNGTELNFHEMYLEKIE